MYSNLEYTYIFQMRSLQVFNASVNCVYMNGYDNRVGYVYEFFFVSLP